VNLSKNLIEGLIMKGSIGIGSVIWKISVALYLIANGVLGLSKYTGGDFIIIFKRMNFSGDMLNLFVLAASIVALVAGIAILLDMFNVQLSFLSTLVFIIAIIWVVYVVIEIIGWLMSGFSDFWHSLQMLAVHLMVLGSLLIASKKFE
jgi:hypothetical protein